MITNTGKGILAKYLVGQAPAYASYIAIGCGAKPLNSASSVQDYSEKESLDFEMFRVPITSRGYVTENGQSKIVFTAELPTSERYEISEVGLWSAGVNPTARSYDSKTVYSFSGSENWEYHNETLAVSIPPIYEPLNTVESENIITTTNKVFQTNSDNRIFTDKKRSSRYERCRFLNNIMALRGDLSNISVENGRLAIPVDEEHIHITGQEIDFNKNSPTDELRLAFSIVNKDGDSAVQPDEVRIMVEFAESDVHGTGQWARFEIVIKESDPGVDFATNRYFVSQKRLEDLYKSTGFTWSVVDVVKIYASVIKTGVVSDDYYVCLDALRLENTTSSNPVYGLTGYSVIKNTNSETIIKIANTTNHIEFRFGLDVV